ncbi:ribonuclease 2 [Cucumis sativus]|uniref:ribonuclease 2 n=1 Tax=Cucumis sativus TaxID=3659 RepID=UPI0005ECBB89|nr:ribonuclease 2 [Cucumis sativus]
MIKAGSRRVVFVVVVVIGIVVVVVDGGGFTVGKEQREFDYFILALQWPSTSCTNVTVCCTTNACCRRAVSPTEFTIHGLWPKYEGKGWPSCCTNETFDETQIRSLFEDVDKYWPTYRCGLVSSCDNRKGSFWAHQYEKHGTCGSPVILQEYDYFLTTLTLFYKYNVTEALENAEIVASDTKKYPIQDVLNAVHSAFKVNPKLACVKKGIIKEIYLCFDKQFKLRDCDATKSCPKSVKLPKFHKPHEPDVIKRAIPIVIDIEEIM